MISNSSYTLKIGKTEFQLIEDYLPQDTEESNEKKIEKVFMTSKPISIPLKRNPSFTSSERTSDSPLILSFEFSPTGKPICLLYNEASKRKPHKDLINCSKIIIP